MFFRKMIFAAAVFSAGLAAFTAPAAAYDDRYPQPLPAKRQSAAPSAGGDGRASVEKAPRTFIVSFGLWGDQSVFASEARGAAQVARVKFGRVARVVVSANTKSGGSATASSLSSTLRAFGGEMDRERDLLVVILTSHGSPDGLAVKAGGFRETLSPSSLGSMLAASGARQKIVIVSSCFSGVFADALADAQTLVVTAADSSHPSFGCRDGATWTYFGEAFFNQGLRRASNMDQAFASGRALVGVRENQQGFASSNPQMSGGGGLKSTVPFLR